jgi:hypothetical protein
LEENAMKSLCVASGVSLVTFLSLIGCGSDDDKKTQDSGLADSTIAGTLTPGQNQALCDELAAKTAGFVGSDGAALLCRSFGLFAAQFSSPTSDAEARAACQSTYDECVASPTQTTTTCKPPSATCTATVGEIRACIATIPATLAALKAAVPECKNLTLAQVDEETPGSEAAPSGPCASVEAKCPDNTNFVPSF